MNYDDYKCATPPEYAEDGYDVRPRGPYASERLSSAEERVHDRYRFAHSIKVARGFGICDACFEDFDGPRVALGGHQLCGKCAEFITEQRKR